MQKSFMTSWNFEVKMQDAVIYQESRWTSLKITQKMTQGMVKFWPQNRSQKMRKYRYAILTLSFGISLDKQMFVGK